MIIKTYLVHKADLVEEANQTEDGRDYITRAVLGLAYDGEFMPTGFNDCYDLVREQIKRKLYGSNS